MSNEAMLTKENEEILRQLKQQMETEMQGHTYDLSAEGDKENYFRMEAKTFEDFIRSTMPAGNDVTVTSKTNPDGEEMLEFQFDIKNEEGRKFYEHLTGEKCTPRIELEIVVDPNAARES